MCTRVEQKVAALKRELREVEAEILEVALAFNSLAREVDPPLEPMDIARTPSPPSPSPDPNACKQPWKTQDGIKTTLADPPTTECAQPAATIMEIPYAPDPNNLTLHDQDNNALDDDALAASLRTDKEYRLLRNH